MKITVDGSAVIFDLDGTLVYSAPDIASSMGHALIRVGRPALGPAQIRSYIGNGAHCLVHRSLTGDVNGVADDALFDAAKAHFFDHYKNNCCRHSTLYTSVIETLHTLHNDGYLLACVTNKSSQFTEMLLTHFGLKHFFSVTVSGDSLDVKKPAPGQLLYVAEQWGISARECVMVGDSVTDILAAHNANMPVICVSYGYGDLADIVSHKPLAVVESFDEIVAVLTNCAAAG